jgi:hypothetical protein
MRRSKAWRRLGRLHGWESLKRFFLPKIDLDSIG